MDYFICSFQIFTLFNVDRLEQISIFLGHLLFLDTVSDTSLVRLGGVDFKIQDVSPGVSEMVFGQSCRSQFYCRM